MTPTYILQVVKEGGEARWPVDNCNGKQESDDDSSKQNGGKRSRLSPTLSISTSWYGHRRTSLSINYVCVSGGANLRPWLVLRKGPSQKANTWGIFNLRKLISCHLVVKGWRHIMSSRFFVWQWRYVIWDMKETQIPK